MNYALITKHRTPDIIIGAETIQELDEAIDRMYWNKAGMKPKGVEHTKEDMLKDYRRVEIIVKELPQLPEVEK